MTTTTDRIETAAQLLHSRRHRAGLGSVCGACRDMVREIADVLDVPRLAAIEQRAIAMRDTGAWRNGAREILGEQA